MGIEPTRPAWEAGVLPLNYACMSRIKPNQTCQTRYIVNISAEIVKRFRHFFIFLITEMFFAGIVFSCASSISSNPVASFCNSCYNKGGFLCISSIEAP